MPECSATDCALSLENPRTRPDIVLGDDEVRELLSSAAVPVVVQASAEGCLACRLLDPIVRKLAAEFAGQMIVAENDNTAGAFYRTYEIHGIPQLLIFVSGEYRGRVRDFRSAKDIRQSILSLSGIRPRHDEPSDAELAFQRAHEQATARLESFTAPVANLLLPRLAEVSAAAAELERAIEAELASGRLTHEQAQERRTTGYTELYAPFRPELEQLNKAQADGLSEYEPIMDAAVDRFIRNINS